ncbi:MAG TPA: alpha/beta hydrolase [Nocardioidaceae bacterium]|nr:alpha/beta hydrolase [Nocardioidaceae bacterium]
MRLPRTARAAAGLLLTVALAGCQGGAGPDGTSGRAPDGAPSQPRPQATGMPDPPAGLESFYTQDVDWRPCAGDFECATVQVPLDYAEPDGKTIGIAVNRRPADDMGALQGALLVNPGGPGVPGKPYARQVAPMLAEVTEEFDLVGFDPRGTGESASVDCLSDDRLDDYLGADMSPDTAAEVTGLQQRIIELGEGCQQRSGELLAHVSTVEAARDLDIIRHIVGDPEMHYFGTSYGTQLGATYAELFPQRVSRMVLDAAVDPTVHGLDLGLAQLAGFETALQAYLRDCVESGDCPLGSSVEEAEGTLVDLLAQIDAEPLPTDTYGDGERQLTSGWAFYGIALPLYAAELWPALTQGLEAALDGDGSVLLRLADAYVARFGGEYVNNSMEAFMAISCLDDPSARTPAQIRDVLPRFEAVSDVFGATFAWGSIGCPRWPVHVEGSVEDAADEIDAAGAEPILVVGTTRDPATPYTWAQSLARQLDSGVLLTREGDGHGAFGHGNSCIDDAVQDYLVDGTVPAAGTTC